MSCRVANIVTSINQFLVSVLIQISKPIHWWNSTHNIQRNGCFTLKSYTELQDWNWIPTVLSELVRWFVSQVDNNNLNVLNLHLSKLDEQSSLSHCKQVFFILLSLTTSGMKSVESCLCYFSHKQCSVCLSPERTFCDYKCLFWGHYKVNENLNGNNSVSHFSQCSKYNNRNQWRSVCPPYIHQVTRDPHSFLTQFSSWFEFKNQTRESIGSPLLEAKNYLILKLHLPTNWSSNLYMVIRTSSTDQRLR